MILRKNISLTPLKQLIASVFLISRTLLLQGREENLRADLPIKKTPGADICLSAERLKTTTRNCSVLCFTESPPGKQTAEKIVPNVSADIQVPGKSYRCGFRSGGFVILPWTRIK
jgi:hypothetical protein